MEPERYGSYPMSFGALLMQNSNAMDYFSSLADVERQAVVEECAAIRSKEEMRAYVEQLGKRKH